jgi:hypothetical protein
VEGENLQELVEKQAEIINNRRAELCGIACLEI